MNHDVPLSLLDNVRIASPCSAKWDDMVGDEKTRHCSQCHLSVHNFSAMTRDEAEGLLRVHFGPNGAGERICGGWYRRADGTAILADCPVGVAKLRMKTRWAIARAAAVLGLSGAAAVAAGTIDPAKAQRPGSASAPMRGLQPFRAICDWISPVAPALPPASTTFAAGGLIAVPPPTANTMPPPSASSMPR